MSRAGLVRCRWGMRTILSGRLLRGVAPHPGNQHWTEYQQNKQLIIPDLTFAHAQALAAVAGRTCTLEGIIHQSAYLVLGGKHLSPSSFHVIVSLAFISSYYPSPSVSAGAVYHLHCPRFSPASRVMTGHDLQSDQALNLPPILL